MENKCLPLVTLEERIRPMGELVPIDPEDFAPTSEAVARHFPVLVADDDEMDRALTIMKLRKASPFEGT